MRFLRALWRFLKAVKDVLALIALLLFFGLIFAALSAGGSKSSIPAGGGALLLQLKGSLSEQPADAKPFDIVSSGGGAQAGEYRLRDVVRAVNAGEPVSPQDRGPFAQAIGRWTLRLTSDEVSKVAAVHFKRRFTFWRRSAMAG